MWAGVGFPACGCQTSRPRPFLAKGRGRREVILDVQAAHRAARQKGRERHRSRSDQAGSLDRNEPRAACTIGAATINSR